MESHEIKIGIAEDHGLFRQSLQILLDEHPQFNVIFAARNGLDLFKNLSGQKPDVLLLDLFMPEVDGFDVLKVINNNYPDIRVIVMSSYYEDNFIHDTLLNGARGYLSKNVSLDLLTKAIISVGSDGYHFDHKVTPALLDQLQINWNNNY